MAAGLERRIRVFIVGLLLDDAVVADGELCCAHCELGLLQGILWYLNRTKIVNPAKNRF